MGVRMSATFSLSVFLKNRKTLALQRKLWEMRSHESTQGATAPSFENCRKCACAFCGVSDAAPKQASCAASPAARPWPLPGRLGRPLCGMGKPGKSKVESREGRASSRPLWPGRSRALPSKNFPTRRRRFPNLVRRGEVARSGCGRMMLASMRRHPGRWLAQRDGAPVS